MLLIIFHVTKGWLCITNNDDNKSMKIVMEIKCINFFTTPALPLLLMMTITMKMIILFKKEQTLSRFTFLAVFAVREHKKTP